MYAGLFLRNIHRYEAIYENKPYSSLRMIIDLSEIFKNRGNEANRIYRVDKIKIQFIKFIQENFPNFRIKVLSDIRFKPYAMDQYCVLSLTSPIPETCKTFERMSVLLSQTKENVTQSIISDGTQEVNSVITSYKGRAAIAGSRYRVVIDFLNICLDYKNTTLNKSVDMNTLPTISTKYSRAEQNTFQPTPSEILENGSIDFNRLFSLKNKTRKTREIQGNDYEKACESVEDMEGILNYEINSRYLRNIILTSTTHNCKKIISATILAEFKPDSRIGGYVLFNGDDIQNMGALATLGRQNYKLEVSDNLECQISYNSPTENRPIFIVNYKTPLANDVVETAGYQQVNLKFSSHGLNVTLLVPGKPAKNEFYEDFVVRHIQLSSLDKISFNGNPRMAVSKILKRC
ncbi:unnamed protein product [Gordionus sp. m RMFG-2023]